MRTLATFRSNIFNTARSKESFLNPCCFGDDVCKWLAGKLMEKNISVAAQIKQEDYGWYFTFCMDHKTYTCTLGYRPEDENTAGDWICFIERKRGIVGSLFGLRTRGINHNAIKAIHNILSESPEIQNLRWHYSTDFDRGLEDMGTEMP